MNIKLLLIPILLLTVNALKALPVKVYGETVGTDVFIYAYNENNVDYSIKLDMTLRNMVANQEFPCIRVIAKGSKQLLLQLSRIKENAAAKWSFNYSVVLGDVLNSFHSDSVIYIFPFKSETCIRVSQGYYGYFSHQDEKAIDFLMPIGTEVLSARAGTVVEVKDNSRLTCPNVSCIGEANFIRILHADGSIATYAHLDYKGVKVSVGQVVNQGAFIGYSGNTGRSSGPHLHFDVALPMFEHPLKKTVDTYFLYNGERMIPQEEDCIGSAY